MKVLSAILACVFVFGAVEGSLTTVTSLGTTTQFIASRTTSTAIATSTSTGLITISLPFSTFTSLTTLPTSTHPATVTSLVEVTTNVASNVVIDVTVPGTGMSTSTVAGSTITTVVTVTGAVVPSVVTVTASGTMTVTTVVTKGFATVNSCIPTTTIYTTTTTGVPAPVAPGGSVVVYERTNCGSVVCPSGSKVITTNGVPKPCVLTRYSGALVSSTCWIEYCCTARETNNGMVIRTTTCGAAGVVCPAGCTPLTNSAGVSVPCLQTYQANKLVSTTCDTTVCCSAAVVPPPVSTTMSCKVGVKCKVYNKDPATNYILRCPMGGCTAALCCQTVKK